MTTLYDAYGRPIDRSRLLGEEAAPTLTGVRQILSGHPAQNLTPRRLAGLLLTAEQGDPVGYLELAEEMEEKDLHYRAVLSTRKIQVAGLPVSVQAASDDAADVRAADLVREVADSGVLQAALPDVMDAVGKGYSACEILWDCQGRDWRPREIVWRDPRWFVFDRTDGKTLLLRGEGGLPEPLAPGKFITHFHKSKSGLPIRGGLARLVAWFYLFKHFDIKAWVQFAQVFGFPLRLGLYDANATEEQKKTLLRAVRMIAQDAAAIIPDSMRIEFQETNSRANAALFSDLAEYLDKQISKAVLGQTGTTDVGQHVGTANAHEKVREDIEESDARQLSATLTRDLVRPLVDLNLGPRERYPALLIAREKAEDVSALIDNVVKLAPIAPNLVEVSVLRDKLGLPEPAASAEVVGYGNRGEGLAGEPATMRKAAHTAETSPDEIETAAREALGGWELLMEPLVNPILALAEDCADYDEFLARLPEVVNTQEPDELARELALAMFEWRVRGAGATQGARQRARSRGTSEYGH